MDAKTHHLVRKLRLRHLELLAALSETATMRGAAAPPYLETSPRSSKMLGEIELPRRTRLFERSHQGIYANALGASAVFTRARGAQRTRARATEDVDALQGGARAPRRCCGSARALRRRHDSGRHRRVAPAGAGRRRAAARRGRVHELIERLLEGELRHRLRRHHARAVRERHHAAARAREGDVARGRTLRARIHRSPRQRRRRPAQAALGRLASPRGCCRRARRAGASGLHDGLPQRRRDAADAVIEACRRSRSAQCCAAIRRCCARWPWAMRSTRSRAAACAGSPSRRGGPAVLRPCSSAATAWSFPPILAGIRRGRCGAEPRRWRRSGAPGPRPERTQGARYSFEIPAPPVVLRIHEVAQPHLAAHWLSIM